jgi:transposase
VEQSPSSTGSAREAGIHASQLYRWRQELCGPARAAASFAAVTIAPELRAAASPAPSCGLIEVELATGARLRIGGAVDAATISAGATAVSCHICR